MSIQNKARTMLLVLSSVVFLCGLLAFKLKRNAVVYCSSIPSNQCEVLKEGWTITNSSIGLISYCAADVGSACSMMTFITQQE